MGVPLGYPPLTSDRFKWQNPAKAGQECIPLLVADQIKLYAMWTLHVLSMYLHTGIDEL